MLDDFLIRALLAGIGVVLAAAPLGCFVVWRRMAYFGDAAAHASILGVALALGFATSIFAGVLVVALGMGLLIGTLSERDHSVDAMLGVLAHGALAFGLVAAALIPGARLDLSAYLFGDILAVSRTDLALIWGGAIGVGALMLWRWQALLTVTLSEALAHAAGLRPGREKLVLTLALAMVVAVAIKVVGALLIAAFLIIPAAAARPLTRSPETMLLLCALIGIVSVFTGLWGALILDTPVGPSIVCAAALLFALSALCHSLRRVVRR